MEIPHADQVGYLTALGFEVSGEGVVVEASVPPWRRDVQGEADLVEEVARMASLTKLEPQAVAAGPQAGVPEPILTPMQLRERVGAADLRGARL